MAPYWPYKNAARTVGMWYISARRMPTWTTMLLLNFFIQPKVHTYHFNSIVRCTVLKKWKICTCLCLTQLALTYPYVRHKCSPCPVTSRICTNIFSLWARRVVLKCYPPVSLEQVCPFFHLWGQLWLRLKKDEGTSELRYLASTFKDKMLHFCAFPFLQIFAFYTGLLANSNTTEELSCSCNHADQNSATMLYKDIHPFRFRFIILMSKCSPYRSPSFIIALDQ